jgi:thiamine biosynthesis lipoprotein
MRSPAVFLVLLAIACDRERPQGELIESESAGAVFVVKLAERLPGNERADVERIVGEALERVSSRASASLPDSDLSRLHTADAGVAIPVSAETLEMMREAVRVGVLTGGAFDVTGAPLARLWGFGPGGSTRSVPPTENEIERERARVGFGHLEIDDDSITITRRTASLEVDLSELASGYALDLAAAALEERGYRNYLIEAGSDVRTRGKDAAGEPWRVPVLKPGPGGGEIQRNLPLSGFSMASSGDYRGADDAEALAGRLHAHLVDPRTGRPLEHGLLSVTVLGENCLTAHALATGLLVLGPEEGFRLAAGEDIAALFLVRSETGALEERATPAFAELFFWSETAGAAAFTEERGKYR